METYVRMIFVFMELLPHVVEVVDVKMERSFVLISKLLHFASLIITTSLSTLLSHAMRQT